MTGYDQALMLMSAIGVGLMMVTLFLVRQQDKHERERKALKRSNGHPAE